MAGPKPQPTAEELEALIDQVRRDPRSPAYLELGEAFLALGRPQDAIQVAQAGLVHAPDDHAGRLVLSRGLAALHQWKEAQAELLKIVKVDRGNRAGFALLGEVLMRRGDYERAMPVLQHAQNLDPSSATVLGLLRVARSGQAMDAPPPVPTPIAPVRRGAAPQPPPPRPPVAPAPRPPVGANPSPPAPPPYAPPPPPSYAPAPPPYAPPPQAAPRAPAPPPPAPPAPPPMIAGPPLPAYVPPAPVAPPPAVAPWPPPVAPPSNLHDTGPTAVGGPRGLRIEAEHAHERGDATVPSAPPEAAWAEPAAQQLVALPMPRPGAEPAAVRPRVLPQAKPQNAAAAALRQSAAVGENYLNDLLTGGLLDVPGVRVPDGGWDLRPEKRWGRSTVKAFVALFVLLVLGLGGGGGWWWYSQKQKAEKVARHRDAARVQLASGSYAGLSSALEQLQLALAADRANPRTFAAIAEAQALRALVYGTGEKGVDTAITGAGRSIKSADKAGYRDLVLARAALALSRLDGSDAALAALVAASKDLDAYATANPDDRWARWLQGRALLAGGQRGAAARAFDDAGAGPDGLALAAIDRADLYIDDGQFDEGMKLYDDVLARFADQPLAIAGRALARAERGADVDLAMKDVNVFLDQDLGPRVAAYGQLVLALSNYGIQKYVASSEALAKATGPRDPRFLARVALARVLEGKLGDAVTALAQVKYYGKDKAETDPQVALVNGALQVAGGEHRAALETLKGLGGTRAALLRGQALHELGQDDDAARELATAMTAAPGSVEIKIWQQLVAAAVAAPGKPRETATAELEKASRASTSKLGRLAHGLALLQQRDLRGARRRLEQSLENITAEEPNPLAYRAHAALAEVARAEGDLAGETEALDRALAANSGYLPALLARAQLYVKAGQGADAVPLVTSVVAVPEYATGASFVLLAEAHARRNLDAELLDSQGKPRPGLAKEALATERRAAVVAALQAAKDAGADPAELARVAALVDPAIATELGVAPPAEVAPAEPPKPTKPTRRPARRRGR